MPTDKPGWGGARPGAGRPKKPPVMLDSEALRTSDPRQFLAALMSDSRVDIKARADAAKVLLSAEVREAQAKGKKDALAERAKEVANSPGLFAYRQSPPPNHPAAG